MELFNLQGHLTDEGISAVVAQELDEMQRLEAAEHLSFCDECLIRYTALLEPAVLCKNAPSVLPSVKKTLRKKLIRFACTKYGTVAAAAAFAIIVSGSGVMSSFATVEQGGAAHIKENALSEGLASISSTVSQFFAKDKPLAPKPQEIKVPKLSEIVAPKEEQAQNNKAQKEELPKKTAKDEAYKNTNPAKDLAQKKNLALDWLTPKLENNKGD